MAVWVAIFAGVWLVFLLAWALTSRAFRNVQAGRITGRLMGTTRAQKRRHQAGPALLRSEDTSTGKLILRLLKRYRYQEWAQQLLEQAGLKWKPVRLAHAALGFFLVGYSLVWFGLPAYRVAAPLAAVAGAALPVL